MFTVRAFRDVLLSKSIVYRTFKSLVSSKSRTKQFVRQYLAEEKNSVVLDLGCGIGDFCKFFVPHCKYVGVDANPNYIALARDQNQSSQATFLIGDISNLDLSAYGPFDLVMMSGVLHHLDSESVLKTLSPVLQVLNTNGRFFAIEPVFEPGQSLVARLTIASDRGQYVRDTEGYRNVLSQLFEEVEIDVRHDVIRIPYTHAVITATKPKKVTFEC
jgi:SAM-dependent methyltransferase